jgi:uncharacterized protein YkwD
MKFLAVTAAALVVSGCVSIFPIVDSRPESKTVDFGPDTLVLINSYRQSNGVSPLASNDTLVRLAREHSQRQASIRAMGHDGFHVRAAKARAAGIGAGCAENVGRDYRDAEHLFSGWRSSPSHRRNLLQPNMRYAGVSVVGGYATFFAC